MMDSEKTYWHLRGEHRVPTEYEIVSTKLLYYPDRGFQVNLPASEWYRQYQQSSPWRCSDWERFADPRQTTYRNYTERQATKEVYLDNLFRGVVDAAYDRALSESWRGTLARVFAPLRYPFHGFQMIAAYFGQMAPSGRIAITALFQAADEMRRIQRVAQRIAQLQESFPEFGGDGKARWQEDPALQPLRKAIEKLLVTYDWGEAFIALNRVLKPEVDTFLWRTLAPLARENGDPYLSALLHSFEEDSEWHRQWTDALVQLTLEDEPTNAAVIDEWERKWRPLAADAAGALVTSVGRC